MPSPMPSLSLLSLAAVLAAGEPLPLPATSPWKPEAFASAPPVEVLASHERGGGTIQDLWFRGPASPGASAGFTQVFAYLGRPAGVSAQHRAPALVLVHGWAGQAMEGWVAEAVKHGYIAISYSTNGLLGDTRIRQEPPWPADRRGPGDGYSGAGETKGPSPFADRTGEDPSAIWMWHAVADGMLANSLLRSLPEVDPARVGVWGISWGGYHTCLLASLDPRFRAAVPQYGCGNLADNGAWVRDFAAMKPEWRLTWTTVWDPARYLPSARVPLFFINGDNDNFYPLDSWMRSYDAVRGAKNLCVLRGFAHGHTWDARLAPVWRWLAGELQGGPVTPRISRPRVAGGRVTATIEGAVAAGDLKQAMLCYTTGPDNQNSKRPWVESRMEIDGVELAGNAPPADATAWYVSVNDTTDPKAHRAIVSSEVVFAAEAAR
jgi:dienelactone hydrolase